MWAFITIHHLRERLLPVWTSSEDSPRSISCIATLIWAFITIHHLLERLLPLCTRARLLGVRSGQRPIRAKLFFPLAVSLPLRRLLTGLTSGRYGVRAPLCSTPLISLKERCIWGQSAPSPLPPLFA